MNRVYGYEGEATKKYGVQMYKLSEEIFTARASRVPFSLSSILRHHSDRPSCAQSRLLRSSPPPPLLAWTPRPTRPTRRCIKA